MAETLTPSTAPSQEELPLVAEGNELFIGDINDDVREPLAFEQKFVDSGEPSSEKLEDDIWWAEELKRLDKYVNHEAKYHVGRKFMIGDEMFVVSFSKPDGSNGNYTTPFIDIQNLSTGEMIEGIEPAAVDAMIKSAETDDASSPELTGTKEQVIEQELAIFDERFNDNPDALPKAEFEAFLQEHKELQSFQETKPITIEDFDIQLIDDPDLQKEVATAIQAFNELASRQPEYESERSGFMADLNSYIANSQDRKRSDYDLAG